MIALAVVAVLAVVVVAAIWARVASSRVERRSVEGYGKALDTLGGVAKRSESGAPVHAPTASELAQPHVRPAPGEAARHVRAPAAPITPTPRIRLHPPVPPGQMPVFSDLGSGGEGAVGSTPVAPPPGAPPAAEEPTVVLPVARHELAGAPGVLGPVDDEPLTMLVPVVPPEPATAVRPLAGPLAPPAGPAADRPAALVVFDDQADAPGGTGPGEAGPGGDERSQRMRRAATGAAAAVALGALAAGGWQLAADSRSHTRAGAPTTAATGTTSAPARTVPTVPAAPATTGAGSASGHAHGSSPTSTTPTTLEPTSATSSLVAYQAPASHYTVSFSVTGSSECWIGAQASTGGGYLWMQTVPPGGTATYAATGPVVIRLGAPPVVSVSVNGIRVALPPGNVQPYDISFTPSSRAA